MLGAIERQAVGLWGEICSCAIFAKRVLLLGPREEQPELGRLPSAAGLGPLRRREGKAPHTQRSALGACPE